MPFPKSFLLDLNQVSVCFLADIISFVLQSSAVLSLTQTALSHGHHMLSLSNYFTNRSETAFTALAAAGSKAYMGSTTPKHWGKLFGSQPWGHIRGSGEKSIIHNPLHSFELRQQADLTQDTVWVKTSQYTSMNDYLESLWSHSWCLKLLQCFINSLQELQITEPMKVAGSHRGGRDRLFCWLVRCVWHVCLCKWESGTIFIGF